jgi:hypothetical protein
MFLLGFPVSFNTFRLHFPSSVPGSDLWGGGGISVYFLLEILNMVIHLLYDRHLDLFTTLNMCVKASINNLKIVIK